MILTFQEKVAELKRYSNYSHLTQEIVVNLTGGDKLHASDCGHSGTYKIIQFQNFLEDPERYLCPRCYSGDLSVRRKPGSLFNQYDLDSLLFEMDALTEHPHIRKNFDKLKAKELMPILILSAGKGFFTVAQYQAAKMPAKKTGLGRIHAAATASSRKLQAEDYFSYLQEQFPGDIAPLGSETHDLTQRAINTGHQDELLEALRKVYAVADKIKEAEANSTKYVVFRNMKYQASSKDYKEILIMTTFQHLILKDKDPDSFWQAPTTIKPFLKRFDYLSALHVEVPAALSGEELKTMAMFYSKHALEMDSLRAMNESYRSVEALR